MKNGLYRAEFGVGGNVGQGVVTLVDGRVSGGDGGFAYLGSVNNQNDQLSGSIEVFQHTPGYPNVFAGLTSFTLSVSGVYHPSTNTAGLSGTTPAAAGQAVKISLQLLRPL